MNAALAKALCDFCGISGHTQPDCFRFKKAQQEAKQSNKARNNKGKKRTEQANAANAAPKDDKSDNGTEFAGNA
ncbi:hypothetical protein DXG01_017038, partial [Tephrocybe rancida]